MLLFSLFARICPLDPIPSQINQLLTPQHDIILPYGPNCSPPDFHLSCWLKCAYVLFRQCVLHLAPFTSSAIGHINDIWRKIRIMARRLFYCRMSCNLSILVVINKYLCCHPLCVCPSVISKKCVLKEDVQIMLPATIPCLYKGWTKVVATPL
jgi:hypothetical protein